MKSMNKTMTIILAILIVAFNLISLFVPVKGVHPVSFWLADCFMVLAILFQYYVLIVAFGKYEGILSRVYGTPIVAVGLKYVVAQFVLSVLVIVLCTFGLRVPAWVIVIPSIVLFTLALIGLLAADAGRDIVESKEDAFAAQTSFMHNFRSEIKTLMIFVKDEEVKDALQELSDDIRYSDPVSSADTFDAETLIDERCADLVNAVHSGADGIVDMVEDIRLMLARRNEICRLNKKRNSKMGTTR